MPSKFCLINILELPSKTPTSLSTWPANVPPPEIETFTWTTFSSDFVADALVAFANSISKPVWELKVELPPRPTLLFGRLVKIVIYQLSMFFLRKCGKGSSSYVKWRGTCI